MRDARIRALKRVHAPSVHGHKPWTSSFVIMDYLTRHRLARGSRVMEIGCGWGPVSVFCAKRFDARVTGVDVDSDVFPYLQALAAANDVTVKPLRSRFERLTARRLGGQDLVVGSDVCFWDEMTTPLFNLIRRAERGGARRVVIADPGRSPFRDLVTRCEERWGADLSARVKVWDWHTRRPKLVDGEILDIVFR